MGLLTCSTIGRIRRRHAHAVADSTGIFGRRGQLDVVGRLGILIPFGMIDFSSVATAQVFALPKLMPYALEFDPEVCITLAVVSR